MTPLSTYPKSSRSITPVKPASAASSRGRKPYVLAFPRDHATQPPWPGFWTALEEQARTDGRWRIFYNVDLGTPQYDELSELALLKKIAGVFFPWNIKRLADTPLLTLPTLPRVACCHEGPVPGALSLSLDTADLCAKVMRHLVAVGRTRLAWLKPAFHDQTIDEFVTRSIYIQAAVHNVETGPHWLYAVSLDTPDRAADVGPALAAAFSEMRHPDALVISNDNLARIAVEGIVATGLRVPEDIYVIAHTNFPLRPALQAPVARCGFDAGEVLRRVASALDYPASVPDDFIAVGARVEPIATPTPAAIPVPA